MRKNHNILNPETINKWIEQHSTKFWATVLIILVLLVITDPMEVFT